MNSRFKSVIIIVFVIAAVVGFFWIAKFFGGGEGVESEKPVVICKPQNAPPEKQECFWTAHIHAHVSVFKSGKEVSLSFEQGNLEEEHTHTEKNRIHWHGLIPVDPKTKQVTDWSKLRIDTIPADLKLTIGGESKFIVNGKEVDPSYIWQDGDHIEIHL